MAGSNRKRKRDKPCKPRGVDSKGIHGATKHRLTEVQKVLLGKGVFARINLRNAAQRKGNNE